MVGVSFAVFEWDWRAAAILNTARTAVVNMLVFGELVYLFNVRHFTAHALPATRCTATRWRSGPGSF